MAGFASTADLAYKAASFDDLGPGLYASRRKATSTPEASPEKMALSW